MKKLIYLILIGFIAICFMNSCAVTDPLSLQVLQQEPPAGKSIIYIYRTSTMGAAVPFAITVNNNEMDHALYGKRFILCTVDTGTYEIKARGETEEKLKVTVKQNNKYFIEVIPRMGILFARCSIFQRNVDDGLTGVKKCKLVEQHALFK